MGKMKIKLDYYSFFIIGSCWLAMGFPLKNYILSAVGLMCTIIGLVNKRNWLKDESVWGKIFPKKKEGFKLFVMILMGIMVIVGIAIFYLSEKGLI